MKSVTVSWFALVSPVKVIVTSGKEWPVLFEVKLVPAGKPG